MRRHRVVPNEIKAEARELASKGLSPEQIALKLGIARSTVQKICKEVAPAPKAKANVAPAPYAVNYRWRTNWH